jgi:hypothetical protein
MVTVCSYCDKGKSPFLAQHTLKHAKSHGLCNWHARFEIARFEKQMARIRIVESQALPALPAIAS